MKQLTIVQSENESIKRQVLMKERLLEAQTESHSKYIDEIREKFVEDTIEFKLTIQRHQMQYEDLWMRTHVHWESIVQLKAQNTELIEQLSVMTTERDEVANNLK